VVVGSRKPIQIKFARTCLSAATGDLNPKSRCSSSLAGFLLAPRASHFVHSQLET